MKGILTGTGIFLWFIASLAAQPRLSADRTEMLIGDQVNLELSFQLPEDARWANPDLTLPDTLTAIETIRESAPSVTTEGGWQKIVKSWIIAPFDTGYVRVPSLPVIMERNGRLDTFMSNDIPFRVEGVVPDSTGLAPIKDILEEPKTWVDYLWVFAILGILAVIFVAYRLLKARPGEAAVEETIVRPAHEVALEKLDMLAEEKRWQKGDLKGYYSALTYIFREYLEKRYQFPALESTSEEISMALKKSGLPEADRQEVQDFLLQSDMVKFAKAQPRVEVHPRLLELARTFILKTRVIETAPAAEEEE